MKSMNFKSGEPHLFLVHALTTAGRGTRNLLLSWRRPNNLLKGKVSRFDTGIVTEFRNKMRMAEDLISKLAFSLREIQDGRLKR